MKKIIILITLLLALASCNQETTPDIKTQNLDAGALEQSSTGNVAVDLNKSYHYLDSLKMSFEENTLKDILSKKDYTIVYFYPLDFTPNCTIQAIDFSTMLEDFDAKWYQIIGVSKNDIESHKKFAEANSLKIKLIQDKNSDLLKEFWALWEPKTYGNGDATTDIIRSTFIVDKNGKAIAAFRDVEAVGHAARIYDFISKL